MNEQDIVDQVGLFTPDPNWSPSKPTVSIYLSCHGRTLMPYLESRKDFRERYNLLRLETGPMLLAQHRGVPIWESQTIQNTFALADVLITYNMGARHGGMALENIRKWLKPSCKVITFVAPNCSCLWPFAHGYSGELAIVDRLDAGDHPEKIWADFVSGKLDPMFRTRWRIEMGRLKDKESYHDIGIADFIIANLRKAKLFMGASHPTYTLMAYVGSEIMARLGLPRDETSTILSFDYTIEIVGGQPETDYEFAHYGFEYPKRHTEDAGGLTGYYRGLFDNFVNHWKAGGLSTPPRD